MVFLPVQFGIKSSSARIQKPRLAHLLAPLLTSWLALCGAAHAESVVPKNHVFSDPKVPFSIQYPYDWLTEELPANLHGVSLLSRKQSPATSVRLLFAKLDGKKLNFAREFRAFEELSEASGLTVKRLSSRLRSYGQQGQGRQVRGVEREYLMKKTTPEKTYTMRLKLWYGGDETYLYSFQLSDTPSRYAKANALFAEMLGTVIFK